MKLYIETYGCQMNINDSEIIAGIMQLHNYEITENAKEADLILINTCSIRDNAEQRIMGRLGYFRELKGYKSSLKVGLVGCMAERLKEKLLNEDVINLVIGPDSYRHLPDLLNSNGEDKRIHVDLSIEETYESVQPLRYDNNGISAFVSITRGCNNFCSYCVVPYTRGRERSRPVDTILHEVKELIDNGYKEATLLGQNVNSYRYETTHGVVDFPWLIEEIAITYPSLRLRFSTSHPKDISERLIDCIAKYPNISKHVHLPSQSGSNAILKKMNRKYTREEYLKKINLIYTKIPGCSITTDIIAGFCGETQQDHEDTLSLMKESRYDYAYMFKYSERPGTKAEETLDDDVPEEVKSARLSEIISLQHNLSMESNQRDLGKTFEVLVEGESKKSSLKLYGRSSQNKVVVFPKENFKKGDLVNVIIEKVTSGTLIGKVVR